MEFHHVPVLFEETIAALAIKPDGIYVDGTLGGAGHSSAIAAKLSEGGRLIGIDRDGEAIEAAAKRLAPFADRVTVVRGNFRDMGDILDGLGVGEVNGILLDLGVSSHQFDDGERGFSYRTDAPLDMRMDKRQALTAADIVNTWSEKDLAFILRTYGEERFAGRIAASIVRARQEKPVKTTFELAELVKNAIPAVKRQTGGHPAKRSFQAIRIACNEELAALEDVLDPAIRRLAPGGRMAVITFHSLEDRIVKNHFKTAENPCTCPPDFPVCMCGKKPYGKIITRHPVTAGETELEANPRAASAKLRVIERTAD